MRGEGVVAYRLISALKKEAEKEKMSKQRPDYEI
jgi:hypothetical protein